MALRTYDSKSVQVIIGGVIMTDFADGTFVSIERDEDTFTKVVGSQGEVARSKTNNRSGQMTITLKQTSPSNAVLTGFAALDELDNDGVVPVLVKDLSGPVPSTYFSGEGWVLKPANVEFSNEITNREWTIDLAIIEMATTGN